MIKNDRIKKKFKLMGLNTNYRVFLYMRLISTIILFVGLLFLSSYGYIVAPICSLVYYFLLEYVILDMGINRRTRELEEDAIQFFSTFLLLLKGGRNIKNSLIMTTNVSDNDLAIEFKKSLATIKNGKMFDEALEDLMDRIPSLLINNIITSIIETSRYGNSINDSVIMQLEYLNDKKKRRIINYYRIIPYKAGFLSLIFGILMIFIIILFAL